MMSVYNRRKTGITEIIYNDQKIILSYKKHINGYNKINRYFKKKKDVAFNTLILLFFDKMMFNRSLYQNKFMLLWDCLLFIFTNRYGKKPFVSKIKYIVKTVLNCP